MVYMYSTECQLLHT